MSRSREWAAGKTRLSLQVDIGLAGTLNFQHGMHFVDLAPISDPAPVASAIASTLNVQEQPGEPLMQTLKAYLVDKETLLLLDNFEQLPGQKPNSASAASLVGQLAKIVANAAGVAGAPRGLYYTDVPEDNPFYLWMMRLTNTGVMSGYNCGGLGEPCDDQQRPYYRPFNNVTRGQARKIVANTFFQNCIPIRPLP